MFGARLQFPASITLAEFSREIPALVDLILKLAQALGDISLGQLASFIWPDN